jgi:hypothetical protein
VIRCNDRVMPHVTSGRNACAPGSRCPAVSANRVPSGTGTAALPKYSTRPCSQHQPGRSIPSKRSCTPPGRPPVLRYKRRGAERSRSSLRQRIHTGRNYGSTYDSSGMERVRRSIVNKIHVRFDEEQLPLLGESHEEIERHALEMIALELYRRRTILAGVPQSSLAWRSSPSSAGLESWASRISI